MDKKIYIVTGSSFGIGKEIANKINASGNIAVTIDKCGEPFYKGDISSKQVLEDFYLKVIRKYNKIDGIVNNAMVSKGGLFDCSYEDFLLVQKIGVVAPFYLAKLFKDHFNDNSSIVNISSSRQFMSEINTESYTSAKGGLSSLTHALMMSLRGKVRVNTVSPGWINTANCELSIEDKYQHPTISVGESLDIANIVLFLLSNDSKFINGENITVDGGMTHQMVYHGDNGWSIKK